MMRKIFIAATFCLMAIAALAQKKPLKGPDRQFDAIFELDKPKPTVLLLGIFHFAGEQVDANTTPSSLRVDMKSAERQKQIEELVKKLSAFKPTKIAIEVSPVLQEYYDSLYQAYLAGKIMNGKYVNAEDESVQIGFRLAKMLNLQCPYAINAQAFRFQLSKKDSVLTFEKYKDQPNPALDYWDKRYEMESAHDDTIAYHLPLNKYLQYLNDPVKQAKTVGRWLVTTKRGTNQEPIGADGFITRYFNRNVRIYSNVQRIVSQPNDRILVIYGATHMYMLKHLFEASPEFNLEDVMKYLK